MRSRLAIVFAAAVTFVMSVPLAAHHTGATLLSEETVTMKGTVESWLWSNPHCLLSINITGEDGEAIKWVLETQAPNSVYSAGYRSNSFKNGDEVTVSFQSAANGQPFGRLSSAVLPDGRQLGGRGRGAAPQGAGPQ